METKLIVSWLYDKAARAHDHSYARMLNMAAKQLRELDEKQRWIPVTERLPEELQKECCAWSERVRPSVDVLVKIKGSKTLYTAWYSYSYKEWTDVREEHSFIGVTHWMPLPEPPKEVE